VNDITTPAIEKDSAAASAGREPTLPSLLQRLMTISRTSTLEEMASGIAHELNQPLGAIVTFAQAGERILNLPDGSVASAREVFQLISQEAMAAAEGIRTMRRLFTRDNFNKESRDIGEVLRELTPVLELLAPQTDAELLVSIDATLPLASIDTLRIQHVLFTLVQNAFEAYAADSAPAPSVSVEVHGDRYGVEVAVIDAGCGIAERQRPQIFHPFFTTKSNGTGLGLASARAIIEAHGGTIGFEIRHTGTRFWFKLPACDQA
jgi:C4-dicarboxylate-specific signal transduction histidine kinase